MTLASLIRLFALAALWGGSFLFMRIAVPVLGAVPTAFGRVALAAAGLMALLAFARLRPAFHGKLGAALVLGVVNSGVPFLMFALAARSLPAGYSAILNATTPLMGVLIGAAAFGERITAARTAGVLLGMAGVAVLAQTGPVALSPQVLAGMGACLVATACYGVTGFLTRRWITARGGLDSRLVAVGSQWGAVLVLAPFAAWEVWRQPELPATWLAAPPAVWAAMLAMGLLCTALAYVLYFRLIADVGPLKALSVTFLVPLFGVAWGWLILGEAATGAHAAGGGLIAAALWLVLRPAPAGAAVTAVRER
ncbi:DMT family transporter [Paracidovorax valerianellae]|uniref:Threonine/homoserine efflux transporter RhtA n=1 Tax=Paracidovorax valerianellae TaxID=187868 RepID=A0A1G6REN9_9BURK|nr:DMT family transporter [Paracidovorax valerianellae]MDA8445029.1 DMT family transporter [Paracidovorax valerianellae]SDD02911.1 Threonine/homoserine efflux transporter RhtA [Paracidovorax valerianellae]